MPSWWKHKSTGFHQDGLRKKALTPDVAVPIAFERSYTWDVRASRLPRIVIGDGRHHTLIMVLI